MQTIIKMILSYDQNKRDEINRLKERVTELEKKNTELMAAKNWAIKALYDLQTDTDATTDDENDDYAARYYVKD